MVTEHKYLSPIPEMILYFLIPLWCPRVIHHWASLSSADPENIENTSANQRCFRENQLCSALIRLGLKIGFSALNGAVSALIFLEISVKSTRVDENIKIWYQNQQVIKRNEELIRMTLPEFEKKRKFSQTPQNSSRAEIFGNLIKNSSH